MPTPEARINIGDTVHIYWCGHGEPDLDQPARYTALVTKVGRKWATLDLKFGGKPYEVNRWTGEGKPNRAGFTAGYRGYTDAMRQEEHRRAKLIADASRHGGYFWRFLTTDEIEQVLAVVEPAFLRDRTYGP